MRVLFLGEGTLDGPARYLTAVLKWAGISFDHRPDQARIPKAWRRRSYDAFILSDYRHSGFTPCAREWLVDQVEQGKTGLLMIGGWASFTGLVGQYAGSRIEMLLPVTCVRKEDRVNYPSGSVMRPAMDHSLLKNLDWQCPPVVCGYHRTKPKKGSRTVLSFQPMIFSKGRARLGRPVPALVLGPENRPRAAAFLTDCAPHWAGGLVDWGKARVAVRVGRSTVDIGKDYAVFLKRLIEWTAGKNPAEEFVR